MGILPFPLGCFPLAFLAPSTSFSQYSTDVGYNLVLDESFSALLPRFSGGVGLGGLVITPSESVLRSTFPSLSPPLFFLVYADSVLVQRWLFAVVGLVWRIGDHTILAAVFAPSLFGLTGPFFSYT